MLQNKKILIGITGSIAAYKIPQLVRLFVKAGAEVKIIITEGGRQFVSPLVLSTLSHQPVLSDLATEDAWANHVMLGRWADLFIIAPLSCNSLARMANGICDNLLSAVYLSATCPVVVAPAMDEDMWHHPSTKANLSAIQSYGVKLIPVESGELASGLVGEGRMAEPETIFRWSTDFFTTQGTLAGVKVLITAGPTYEPLDPVRFIGNHSSGKMGIAIAAACAARGAAVTLVLGPSQEKDPAGVKVVRVKTAAEMLAACEQAFPESAIAIMSAAVADYTPETTADEKIKKQEERFTLSLKKTRDILGTLGQHKKEGQVLVGFALETNNEKAYALGKLNSKNADLIVLNSLRDAGAGFGHDTNKITIYDRKGNEYAFDLKPKNEVASDIVNTIIQYRQ